ncbi:G-protein coupled receptor Mth2-like [Mytilus trossulus]|uniref:G-protein coupled receptor Mth2-like n=1 Tax=Mytilus trossulus TaxID=6551 RepID=UPI0030071A00
MYVYRRVSSLLECPQIQLEADEIQITNDKTKVRIIRSGVELNYYQFFFINENAIRICRSLFYGIVEATKQENTPVIKIIILIGTTLSLIALLLTFFTYCMFPTLRTLPGKNNMSLVFALFCAYTFLEFGIERTENKLGCMMLGICIHFFWLSTFGCVNVCSFHMYSTFRQNFIFQSYDQERDRKRFALYNLYSYGVPLFFVGLNVIISNLVIDDQSFGYGGKACFISHQLTVLSTFIAPVAVICLVNLVLFIFTAINIASTPKACATDSFSQNKIQFSVYVKLFILTGGSWILQILDSFFPLSVFSILVSTLNSFQGIYIFFSYICNQRVFNLYRNLTEHKQVDTIKTDQRSSKSKTSFLSTVSVNKNRNDKEVSLGQSKQDEGVVSTIM